MAGTVVATARGPVPIEEIGVEEPIETFDAVASTFVRSEVSQVFRSNRRAIVVLRVDGEEIRCTPPHRFFTGQWTAARFLRAGDSVLGKDGAWHVVESVAALDAPQPVFNLTVSKTHTYLVGTPGLVVHNTKMNEGGDDDDKEETD